ncbi:hypothetical protein CP8484711_0836B, partial [Chlamydia psittaci 84-8471/1]
QVKALGPVIKACTNQLILPVTVSTNATDIPKPLAVETRAEQAR